jgi:DNA polymerase elongation subunit (family B)
MYAVPFWSLSRIAREPSVLLTSASQRRNDACGFRLSARAKHLSKDPKSYKQLVSQVIAAKQLMKEGVEVAAGKNVKFLFTSAENKRYERRVTAEELIEKNTNSDVKKYLLLLYASAVSMFSPFGYSAGTIYDEVRGHRQIRLFA